MEAANAAEVDGSVAADRCVYDKVDSKLIREVVGYKPTEKRLGGGVDTGGVVETKIEDEQKMTSRVDSGRSKTS